MHQICSVETLEAVILRRYTDLPASSSVAWERRKCEVRNKEVADEQKRILPVAALSE